MSFTSMFFSLFIGIFAFTTMTPMLYSEGRNFPYFDDYYEVQGVVESFQKHASAKTYWVTLTLEDGSEYYIDPNLREAYGEWAITQTIDYVKPGKTVLLKVFDFTNGPYTPAIASLNCDNHEIISLETSLEIYRDVHKEDRCVFLGCELLSLIALAVVGTCAVLQVIMLKFISIRQHKTPTRYGIIAHVIWMPSWMLVTILVIAYLFFGMGLLAHRQCMDIFNIPKLSNCQEFEGSVKNISVTPDEEFLQIDFGEEKVYFPVKYSNNNLQIQTLYSIQEGTTLNVSVYQIPYKGGMISGILELSDFQKTYVTYQDAKNLYYRMAEIGRLYPSKCYIKAAILYVILTIIVLLRKYNSGERLKYAKKYESMSGHKS